MRLPVTWFGRVRGGVESFVSNEGGELDVFVGTL